jgi:hypothetical protein
VTKRRDILNKLKAAARTAGLDFEVVEGGRDALFIIQGLRTPVGRHTEIPNRDAENIYKEAVPKLGEGWWK